MPGYLPRRQAEKVRGGGRKIFIKINGRESEVADSANIREIVQAGEFKDSLIVVQLNGQVTLRDAWESLLKPADNIEIVRVIGGG